MSSFRIASSGVLYRVALVRTDVLEELNTSFIMVTRIGELGTTLAAISNRRTLRRNTTRRNIPEDAILHSRRRESLKSYLSSFKPCYNKTVITKMLFIAGF
jgi:hypothetical protein